MDATIQKVAKHFLSKVAPNDMFVLVGIHVRLTDYGNHLKRFYNGQLLSKLYFTHAMSYFRSKYGKNLRFVVASDDKKRCQDMFQNVTDLVITSENCMDTMDLAILAQCHHSIIRYGIYYSLYHP